MCKPPTESELEQARRVDELLRNADVFEIAARAIQGDDLARENRAQLSAIRRLHCRYRSPLSDDDCCEHCNRISGSLVPYPCDTIRAIGEAS